MKKSIEIDKSQITKWLRDESNPSGQEIQQTEDAMVKFASSYALTPDPALKEKILSKIHSLNSFKKNRQILDPDHLPILDETSNWLDWEEAVKEIKPPDHFEGIHLHSLESTEKRDLFVAWVKEYVEEEVHTDLIESFILLEGTCECHITDTEGNARVVRMQAGDYIKMQVGEIHDVIITSREPAKAILQWLKLSA